MEYEAGLEPAKKRSLQSRAFPFCHSYNSLAAAPRFELEIRESKSRVLPVTLHCYFFGREKWTARIGMPHHINADFMKVLLTTMEGGNAVFAGAKNCERLNYRTNYLKNGTLPETRTRKILHLKQACMPIPSAGFKKIGMP